MTTFLFTLLPRLAGTKECDALACQEPGEHKTLLKLQLKFVNQLETSPVQSSPACQAGGSWVVSEEPTVVINSVAVLSSQQSQY